MNEPVRKVLIVGTIGHVDHNKTALLGAILALSRHYPVELVEVLDDRIVIEEEVPCVYALEAPDLNPVHYAIEKPKLYPYGPTQRGRKGKHKRW